MTREELNSVMDSVESVTVEERSRTVQQIANTDENVIPLLCEMWSEARRPLSLVQKQAISVTILFWLSFITVYYMLVNPHGQYYVPKETARVWTIMLMGFGIVSVVRGFQVVSTARRRAIWAEEVMAAIERPDRLETLLTCCYWRRGDSEKTLIHPAVIAVNRLASDVSSFTINMMESSQVEAIRGLLSRDNDMYWKRKLIFRLLRVVGRDELVEFLPEIKTLSNIYNDPALGSAAKTCLVRLEQAARRRKLEFTLLRPADPLTDDKTLLRPVSGSSRSNENLLMTVEKGD